MKWITGNKIPIGEWAMSGIDWVAQFGHETGIAQTSGWALRAMLGFAQACLVTPGILVVTVIIVAACWTLTRRYGFTIFIAVTLLLIANLGYWSEAVYTVSFILVATLTCLVFGVPMGFAVAFFPKSARILQSLLAIVPYSLPVLILTPVVKIVGTGSDAALVAAILIAICPIIRCASSGVLLAMREAQPESETSTPKQRVDLWRGYLTASTSHICQGLKKALFLTLLMSMITGVLGAGGLGGRAWRSVQYSDQALGAEMGLIFLLLAAVVHMMFKYRRRDASF